MKVEIKSFLAIIGSIITMFWGSIPFAVKVLVFMAFFDYISGMYAAYTLKQWSSKIGSKGAAKKVFMFFLCVIAFLIDKLLHASSLLYNAVIFWYIGNEALSILENAIKLDLKVPNKLKNAINTMVSEGDDDHANNSV